VSVSRRIRDRSVLVQSPGRGRKDRRLYGPGDAPGEANERPGDEAGDGLSNVPETGPEAAPETVSNAARRRSGDGPVCGPETVRRRPLLRVRRRSVYGPGGGLGDGPFDCPGGGFGGGPKCGPRDGCGRHPDVAPRRKGVRFAGPGAGKKPKHRPKVAETASLGGSEACPEKGRLPQEAVPKEDGPENGPRLSAHAFRCRLSILLFPSSRSSGRRRGTLAWLGIVALRL
jgi:hypothetical protein